MLRLKYLRFDKIQLPSAVLILKALKSVYAFGNNRVKNTLRTILTDQLLIPFIKGHVPQSRTHHRNHSLIFHVQKLDEHR